MIDGKKGLLLCARYALAPNFFGYCGPRKSASLIDHLKEEIVDEEVNHILSDFETMTPYLQLIARKNHLPSPFLYPVVEAYWIGNELLKPLSPLEFSAFTQEKLFLDKKLPNINILNLKLKIKNLKFSFLPHHAFHVFNIFKRTGKTNDWHTLETMDQCRIGWGKVIKVQSSKLKVQNEIKVEANILIKEDGRLKLSQPIKKQIKLDYRGKKIAKEIKIGDWVSFHWGFFCDLLTERQQKNLAFFTQKAIEFYNQKNFSNYLYMLSSGYSH